MDINILVEPVCERQRAQLTDISNPDVNYALCAYGYTHRKGKPVRRHVKVLTCYEIGQQADYNY
jgi:hypothetical protein